LNRSEARRPSRRALIRTAAKTNAARRLNTYDDVAAKNAGAHRSVAQLEATIREFIDARHANPKPFVWIKTADQILENIARFAQRTFDFQIAPLIARTTRSAD